MHPRIALPLFFALVLALAATLVPAAPSQALTPLPTQPLIIVDLTQGYLVGAAHMDAWLDGEMAAAQVHPKMNYNLYTLYRMGPPAIGGAPEQSAVEVCPETWSVPLTLTSVPSGHIIALGNVDFDPQPRMPEALPVTSETYRGFVADFLRSQGLQNPEVRIDQLMRIDIEGDGVDEVLITATRLSDEMWTISPGDYSVVLLRTVQGNQAVTTMLSGEIYPRGEEFAAPNMYTIAGLLDLDRDGVLEILMASRYYEGSSIMVLGKFVDGWQLLLNAGCGL